MIHTLTSREAQADSVHRFRWVECQFEALKQCPRSESHLDHCLQSLPENLDKTYERLLCSIDKESVDDARQILTLLCFSSRPLTVDELIDGIAVDLPEPAHLDLRRRLHDADDIRGICPGLIDIAFEEDDSRYDNEVVLTIDGYDTSKEDNEDGENEEDEEDEKEEEEEEDEEDNGMADQLVPTIRIAHFSVQEYLESDRIQEQKAAAFALKSSFAHAEITKIPLVYLREPELSKGNLI